MTTEPGWHPPSRRLLVFLAVGYLFVGVRLAVGPSAVSGGPPFAALFLVAAAAVALEALFPYHRELRAVAGALATVAPAGRALVLLLDGSPSDALVAAAAWVLVAGLVLFSWARVTPPPRARCQ